MGLTCPNPQCILFERSFNNADLIKGDTYVHRFNDL